MLLKELYTTQEKTIKTNRVFNDENRSIKFDDNAGYYSKVEDKRDDPFLVKKSTLRVQDSNNQDGYWEFVKGIVNDESLKNNPFLPRIYSIKTYIDSENKRHFKADIEKLTKGSDIEYDVLKGYLYNLLNVIAHDKYDLLYYTCESLIKLIRNPIPNTIDENLKKALRYIKSFNKYNIDIHQHNIMFRRTPHGVQLVITDPIGGFKRV